MPTNKRGKRAKTKPEKHRRREDARSLENQAHRLQKAIAKSLELNQQAAEAALEAASTGASSSSNRPADLLDSAPTGVHLVSLDSESDQTGSDQEPVTQSATPAPTEARKGPEGPTRPDSPCTVNHQGTNTTYYRQ